MKCDRELITKMFARIFGENSASSIILEKQDVTEDEICDVIFAKYMTDISSVEILKDQIGAEIYTLLSLQCSSEEKVLAMAKRIAREAGKYNLNIGPILLDFVDSLPHPENPSENEV